MKRLKLGNLHYAISRLNEPSIAIEPGESVVVETEDTFIGMIKKLGDWKGAKIPWGNPLSGPIHVEGAEKGDMLAVEIKGIKPLTGQGATRVNVDGLLDILNPTGLLDVEIPRKVWICPIKNEKVYWTKDIVLPYEPMIGTIGTAPEVESTMRAGPYGGNMDLTDLTIGNSLYLPVFVKGALLHVGDVHAVQGDGELCGTAVEMPAEVTLTVGLIKNKTIGWPRIESPSHIMAVGSGRPMEDAVRIAFRELILWLHSEYGFDRLDAYNLCTQVSKIGVGYYLASVVAKFPKRLLERNLNTKPSYQVQGDMAQ